jgi:uncharacterized protein (DUF736 family)
VQQRVCVNRIRAFELQVMVVILVNKSNVNDEVPDYEITRIIMVIGIALYGNVRVTYATPYF